MENTKQQLRETLKEEKPVLKIRTDIISEQLHDVNAMINRSQDLIRRIYPFNEKDECEATMPSPPIGCLVDEMDDWRDRLNRMQVKMHDIVQHLEKTIGC